MAALRLKKHQAARESDEIRTVRQRAGQARRPRSRQRRRASATSSTTTSRPRRSAITSTFVVEHHFTGFGQVSATLNLLTWVAARTTTLRLGTAVMVLPWHNPVLLAEQAATIDLLSGGRLDFGVGKGYRHNEFASFCIPMEEADERFEECARADPQGRGPPTSASRTTASTGISTTSWSSRRRGRSRIRRSGWRRASRTRSARWRGAAPSCCSTSSPRPRPTIERFNIYKAEVEALRPALRPDGCRRRARLLCGEGRRRQAPGGRGAARQPAAA